MSPTTSEDHRQLESRASTELAQCGDIAGALPAEAEVLPFDKGDGLRWTSTW